MRLTGTEGRTAAVLKSAPDLPGLWRTFHQHPHVGQNVPAIVIIYYKAVLDVYMPELFDRAFPRIVLMNWRDMDQLIDPATYRGLADYLPGDCICQESDVDPLTPEWRGNVIDLGNGRYYGHGIGLGSIDYFIDALNRNEEKARRHPPTLWTPLRDLIFGSVPVRKNAS